jgi:hypothetical protein
MALDDAADVDAPSIARVDWQRMPAPISPSELVESHRLRVAALETAAGAQPIRLRSVEDVKSSINRLQSILIANTAPFDLAEHFRRTNAVGRQRSLMQMVATELQRLQVCRRCGYDLTGNISGVCPECSAPMASSVDTPE